MDVEPRAERPFENVDRVDVGDLYVRPHEVVDGGRRDQEERQNRLDGEQTDRRGVSLDPYPAYSAAKRSHPTATSPEPAHSTSTHVSLVCTPTLTNRNRYATDH